MPAAFEVQFEMTRDDFLRFVRHSAGHDPHMLALRRRARRQITFWLMMFAVFFTVVAFLRTPTQAPHGIVVSLIARTLVALVFGGGLFLALFGTAMLVPFLIGAIRGGFAGRMERYYRGALDRGEIEPEFGSHLLSASEAGLVVSGVGTSTADSWERIRLVETDWAFLLYRNINSAHVLPKRAFASEAEQDAFRRAVHAWTSQARDREIPAVTV